MSGASCAWTLEVRPAHGSQIMLRGDGSGHPQFGILYGFFAVNRPRRREDLDAYVVGAEECAQGPEPLKPPAPRLSQGEIERIAYGRLHARFGTVLQGNPRLDDGHLGMRRPSQRIAGKKASATTRTARITLPCPSTLIISSSLTPTV